MARSTRKNFRSARKGVRKTRAKRRAYRKGGRRKSRIFTKRLGSRYPLGQRATIKMSWTDSGSLTGNGVSTSVSSSIYTLNSLSTPAKNGTTDNRAAKFLSNSFNKYRVRGMSYKITATYLNTSTAQPCYMWFIPYSNDDPPNTTAGGDPGELEQINMAKYRMLDAFNASGRFSVMKGYVDCAKLRGDREAVTDGEYDGGVGITGLWTNPSKLFNYQFGWGTVNQSVSASTSIVHYTIKTTYYVEHFDVAMNGIE